MSRQTVVSEHALIGRINRVLAKEDEVLRKTRGAAAEHDLGLFYILDIRGNYVVAQHCDLEATAKELGCLADGERLND